MGAVRPTSGISIKGFQAGDEGGIQPPGSASQDPKNLPLLLQRGGRARAALTPAREEPRLRRGLSSGGAVRRGRLPATGRRASSLPGPEAKPDAGGSPECAKTGSPTRKAETCLRCPSQTRSRECRCQDAPKQHFLCQCQGGGGGDEPWRVSTARGSTALVHVQSVSHPPGPVCTLRFLNRLSHTPGA